MNWELALKQGSADAEEQRAGADEIQRLRDEIATLRPSGLSRVWDDYCATVQLVTQFSSGNPNLSDRVGAAIAEIEQLRAIVDRLPKTADGVPVVGGMEVWRARADAVIHRFVMITDVDTEGSDPVTLCYSTREAAQKDLEPGGHISDHDLQAAGVTK